MCNPHGLETVVRGLVHRCAHRPRAHLWLGARNSHVHIATEYMIEIGNTLRDARRRQGLELGDCEHETRIRGRYLMALEDERFDMLPEPAYARGFLRSYAIFLGLDADLLMDELDERFRGMRTNPELGMSLPEPSRRLSRGPRGRAHRRRGFRKKRAMGWLVAGALGTLLVALWAGAAWKVNPSSIRLTTTVGSTNTTPASTTGGATTTPSGSLPPPATPTTQINFVGSPGTGSRLMLRQGSATGHVMFDGTIGPGVTNQYPLGNGVWMQIDATMGVQLFVGGQPIQIPGGVTHLVVSATGAVTPA